MGCYGLRLYLQWSGKAYFEEADCTEGRHILGNSAGNVCGKGHASQCRAVLPHPERRGLSFGRNVYLNVFDAVIGGFRPSLLIWLILR